MTTNAKLSDKTATPSRRVCSIALRGLALIFLFGCSDPGMPAMTADSTRLARMSATELDAVERDAITQILSRVKQASDREAMRAFLENPRMSFEVRGGEDPEEVRLLRVVTAVREARARKLDAGIAAGSSTEKEEVLVRVAMVKTLRAGDGIVRAVLRREPGDLGRPLLIVLESATPGDVERGLRAAIQSIKRDGVETHDIIIRRFRKPPSKGLEAAKRGSKVLDHVREGDQQRVPGVGLGRLRMVSVR